MKYKSERIKKFKDRFEAFTNLACLVLEYLAVLLVLFAVIMTFWNILPEVGRLVTAEVNTKVFMEFLERILAVVIGVEFIKMLCHPSTAHVVETVIFVVARHMIVLDTTPKEDLYAAASITLLIGAEWFLKHKKAEKVEKPEKES